MNRIPIVKNNWKNAPNAPLKDVSAISDINIGATTQVAPVAIPNKQGSYIYIFHIKLFKQTITYQLRNEQNKAFQRWKLKQCTPN